MFRGNTSFTNLVVAAALYCSNSLEAVKAKSEENEDVITPGTDPKCVVSMEVPSDGSNAASTG